MVWAYYSVTMTYFNRAYNICTYFSPWFFLDVVSSRHGRFKWFHQRNPMWWLCWLPIIAVHSQAILWTWQILIFNPPDFWSFPHEFSSSSTNRHWATSSQPLIKLGLLILEMSGKSVIFIPQHHTGPKKTSSICLDLLIGVTRYLSKISLTLSVLCARRRLRAGYFRGYLWIEPSPRSMAVFEFFKSDHY